MSSQKLYIKLLYSCCRESSFIVKPPWSASALGRYRGFAKSRDDALGAWIPPNRPLVGDSFDIGQADAYHVKDELEETKRSGDGGIGFGEAGPVDWLKTRRSKLSSLSTSDDISEDLVRPDESLKRRQLAADLPIKKHTLLSKDEIASCLNSLGGQEITMVLDDPNKRRLGGPIGLVVVTAPSNSMIRVLANNLARQLRRRNLQDLGVIGAQLGPEGADDEDEKWMIVDCMNYIVHIQDDETRRQINLEGLWTGKDGLFSIDPLDENAVDDYVAANPVPDLFSKSKVTWEETFRQLQKNSGSAYPGTHNGKYRKPR